MSQNSKTVGKNAVGCEFFCHVVLAEILGPLVTVTIRHCGLLRVLLIAETDSVFTEQLAGNETLRYVLMCKCLTAALAALLIWSGGCSVFRPARQSVIITPSDPKAHVYVDGAQVGTGTTSVDLQRNKSHSVVAKVGERAGSAGIGTKISTTGILDIAGGFVWLAPFAGIAAPGFYDLDTTSVHVPIPLDPARVSQASYEQD